MSKNFGWSPSGDGAPPLKSPSGVAASEGHDTASLPLGLILPKITSATAVPASVLPWYAMSRPSAVWPGPSPTGRPAVTTTVTGLPGAGTAVHRAFWSAGSRGDATFTTSQDYAVA